MDQVSIVEVAPRDGLQHEPVLVSPLDRIALIERLAEAGLAAIEAGSFVSPKVMPQMAGTGEVLHAFAGRPQLRLPVLIATEKGLDQALAAGARDIVVAAAASDSYSRRSLNGSIAEAIERLRPLIGRAAAAGMRVRASISCALGCPYEGSIAVSQVVDLAEALHGLGAHEILLADTIGVGTPGRAKALVRAVATIVPIGRLAVHFHDTYGQGLANIYAALEEGIRTVDAAVGGLGCCTFAKGAAGNVATEDLVYMLHGLGMKTGINLEQLVEVAAWISADLNRPLSSHVGRALRAA
ncbi:MAG: hydroxymethylglutaryl-CoA lyase [Ancalomicrobiaceae bacterium]|nr:hydroxymethylglutaryl-CoA lyase [Ancalomicrobiaceae bacterium]